MIGLLLTLVGFTLLMSPWVTFLGATIWLNGRFDWLSIRGRSPLYMPMKRLDIYSTAAWLFTGSHRGLEDRATSRVVWLARACVPLLPISFMTWLAIT
jgi:hypothetical protein